MTAGFYQDRSGQTYGRLTVIERAPQPSHHTRKAVYWKCRCECGGETLARGDHLTMGRVVSCGCYHAERLVAVKLTHGHTSQDHPNSQSAEYNSWAGMKYRCSADAPASQRKYHYDMGVRVAPEWLDDFPAFLAHVGPRPSNKHSLDRYPDPFGNYEPGNVRWASPRQQWENSRPEYLKRQAAE